MTTALDKIATEPAVDPDPEGEILNVHAARAYLQISLPTLMDLITSGQLRAARVGKQWRIRRTWIHEFLDNAAAQAA